MLEIILTVYLIGCILVGISYFSLCLVETNKITLGDLLYGILITLLSWMSIIACLLQSLSDFISDHKNDTIFKGKSRP